VELVRPIGYLTVSSRYCGTGSFEWVPRSE